MTTTEKRRTVERNAVQRRRLRRVRRVRARVPSNVRARARKTFALAYVQTGKRRAGAGITERELKEGRGKTKLGWSASHTKGIFLHKNIREMSQSPWPKLILIWPLICIHPILLKSSS